MSQIWLCADTHYGHTNIIKYSARPFSTTEEHDETLIDNWNRCVQTGDTVYFLGDFCYGKGADAERYRSRLNGNIFFIRGNHDKAAEKIKDSFSFFKDVYEAKISHPSVGEVRVFMHHYAQRVWNKSHYGAWHCYGHSHHSLQDLTYSLSTDVGVDAVAMRAAGIPSGLRDLPHGVTKPEDYRPISIAEVGEIMKAKTFVPIDHHGKL